MAISPNVRPRPTIRITVPQGWQARRHLLDPCEVISEDLPSTLDGLDAAIEYLSAHLPDSDPLLRRVWAERDRVMMGMLQGAGYDL